MFPERFTVGHRARTKVYDGMSWVDGHSDPVDRPVFGWGPPAPDDILRAEQTGTEAHLDVYCREPFAKHRDKLVINGVEWDVEGDPDDSRYGPFGFAPGVRIRCKRVVG